MIQKTVEVRSKGEVVANATFDQYEDYEETLDVLGDEEIHRICNAILETKASNTARTEATRVVTSRQKLAKMIRDDKSGETTIIVEAALRKLNEQQEQQEAKVEETEEVEV